MYICFLVDTYGQHFYYAGVGNDGNALITLNWRESKTFDHIYIPEVARQMIAGRTIFSLSFRSIKMTGENEFIIL